jgi:hypothetical protein
MRDRCRAAGELEYEVAGSDMHNLRARRDVCGLLDESSTGVHVFAATQPVPEPASLPLFATGAAALCASDETIA